MSKNLLNDTELADQLAVASNALQAQFRQREAERVALYTEMQRIANAPPARVDLAEWLADFVEKTLSAEPHGHRTKLIQHLEGLRNNYAGREDVKAGWLTSYWSGLEDFAWLLLPLMSETLKANCAKVADSIHWPNPGLPVAERAARVKELEAQAAALAQKIEALVDRASRLNIKLTV
jgi:hypothetical protein